MQRCILRLPHPNRNPIGTFHKPVLRPGSCYRTVSDAAPPANECTTPDGARHTRPVGAAPRVRVLPSAWTSPARSVLHAPEPPVPLVTQLRLLRSALPRFRLMLKAASRARRRPCPPGEGPVRRSVGKGCVRRGLVAAGVSVQTAFVGCRCRVLERRPRASRRKPPKPLPYTVRVHCDPQFPAFNAPL